MILVTGGAGFIGGNFLYYLYNNKLTNKVVCVDNLTYASNIDYIQPLIDKGFVIFEKADIASKEDIQRIYTTYNPTRIINFAAESHVDNSINDYEPFIHTNILGTINLMQNALSLKGLQRFIHISTDEVYGSLSLSDEQGFNETTQYNPNNPYSASKASSDHFVRAFHKTYGLPAIITNCSNNYGPGQNTEKFIPTIITKALNDEKVPVYGDGLYVRDWLFVLDHCKGIYMVLQNGRIGEKYNIGGGTELPNIEITRTILDKLGKPHSLIEMVKDRPGHDRRYSIDCTKITDELGYKPDYDMKTGLELTIKEFLNEHK
jgi:dTDP-glucose 4,6-dehydratase